MKIASQNRNFGLVPKFSKIEFFDFFFFLYIILTAKKIYSKKISPKKIPKVGNFPLSLNFPRKKGSLFSIFFLEFSYYFSQIPIEISDRCTLADFFISIYPLFKSLLKISHLCRKIHTI